MNKKDIFFVEDGRYKVKPITNKEVLKYLIGGNRYKPNLLSEKKSTNYLLGLDDDALKKFIRKNPTTLLAVYKKEPLEIFIDNTWKPFDYSTGFNHLAEYRRVDTSINVLTKDEVLLIQENIFNLIRNFPHLIEPYLTRENIYCLSKGKWLFVKYPSFTKDNKYTVICTENTTYGSVEQKLSVVKNEDGSKNKFYDIPEWVVDIDDLAEYLQLDPYEFNILKTLTAKLGKRHSGTNELRELKKRKYYAEKCLLKYERSR